MHMVMFTHMVIKSNNQLKTAGDFPKFYSRQSVLLIVPLHHNVLKFLLEHYLILALSQI